MMPNLSEFSLLLVKAIDLDIMLIPPSAGHTCNTIEQSSLHTEVLNWDYEGET